jgi:hypothetical protein
LKKDLKNLLTNQEKCAIIIIPKGERKAKATPPKEKKYFIIERN